MMKNGVEWATIGEKRGNPQLIMVITQDNLQTMRAGHIIQEHYTVLYTFTVLYLYVAAITLKVCKTNGVKCKD